MTDVFPFLCRMVEQNFVAANGCREKGDAEGAQQGHMAGRCKRVVEEGDA